MNLKKNFVIVCFDLLLAYSGGITYKFGMKRISKGLNRHIFVPAKEVIFGHHPVLADYSEQPCPTDHLIGIAYFGQSNATNTVEPKASILIPENLLQYDWKSSKCYAYKEPLLGADFTRGNNLTYAAVEIANNSTKTVVVIPFGFGPSSVLEWAYGAGLSQHSIVLARLKESGLSPQVFLWHQGESDTQTDGIDENMLSEVPYFQRPVRPLDEGRYRFGLSKDSYKTALAKVVERAFRAFPESHFGIALVSHAPCLLSNEKWQPIRAAQQEVAMSDPRIFISADSDKISDAASRYDTCHFSSESAKRLSDEYFTSISALDIF